MTDGRRLLVRVAPLLLVVAIAAGWVLPEPAWLRLSLDDDTAAMRMAPALETLPDDPIIIVGFDPDLGTYPEVRSTARALIADLLSRDGRLVFVSFTPEGRALAGAELARLARGAVDTARLLDLGFVAGAEAGLVDLTRRISAPDADGVLARTIAAEGVAAADGIVIVGGNDLGPRSWIEQVLPRIDDVVVVAVTPTILLPEVQPYLAGGQLDAALTTPREGAAYRASLDLGSLGRLTDAREPSVVALLIGMVIAIAVLGQALGARLFGTLGPLRARDESA